MGDIGTLKFDNPGRENNAKIAKANSTAGVLGYQRRV
jgi:hypothetical protein